MRNKLVAPFAALLVVGLAVAAVLHASLTRLPELEAEPETTSPQVELVGRLSRAKIKAGEPLPVEFRLKNVGRRSVWALPLVEGSDTGSRCPLGTVVIQDADGAVQTKAPGHGRQDILMESDFQRLRPGESSWPLQHDLLDWIPPRPGTYTIEMTYDSTPRPAKSWAGRDGDPTPGALRLLREIPRLLLHAQVTVEVEDEE